jgi:homogentisate 1,2-dioxygenase
VRYEARGELPSKRHVAFRDNGTLLTEEVMGFEGFSGNESILYHLQTPCRVTELGAFEPIEREEWVPDAHSHHLLNTAGLGAEGDSVTGRRLLMWNQDVEIAICRPATSAARNGASHNGPAGAPARPATGPAGTPARPATDPAGAPARPATGPAGASARPATGPAGAPAHYFYRNGEGDEVIFVHEGRGELETSFGILPYREHDYIVIPRGTTYRFVPEGEQLWLTFHTPGEIETPNRYRNRYGQLLEHAPYSHRDFHPPGELVTHRERGDFDLVVRVRDGYQHYKLDYHPLDVVGWDGYVYPYTFNIDDFEPITGRIHMPPPVHQTFQGPNFVICSFCPRMLDWHEEAIPIPYNHSNLQSEEMIYYVSGSFGSRRGIDVGSITLHPSGLPHGPQPGLAEKSIGTRFTEELAVMCDTFRPLRLSQLARELDDGKYALSWAVDRDADATSAGVTSHI